MIKRLAILAVVSSMCIAATGPCSTGPINSASAAHACDTAARVGARADEIMTALQAIGVAPAKIAVILQRIRQGEAAITTTCAVIDVLPHPIP